TKSVRRLVVRRPRLPVHAPRTLDRRLRVPGRAPVSHRLRVRRLRARANRGRAEQFLASRAVLVAPPRLVRRAGKGRRDGTEGRPGLRGALERGEAKPVTSPMLTQTVLAGSALPWTVLLKGDSDGQELRSRNDRRERRRGREEVLRPPRLPRGPIGRDLRARD